MKILVYPHAMEIGGSQLNAIELAGALAARGHHVCLASEPGPLVARVRALGLDHIELPLRRSRPSPSVVRRLRSLIAGERFDVLHAFEWPPAIEVYLCTLLRRRPAAVATVMSMGVPWFLPRDLPVTFGTRSLVTQARGLGLQDVRLLEPPVDTEANMPGGTSEAVFRDLVPELPGTADVLVVSRLAAELKLSGLIEAVDAVADLPADLRARLVIVGDGPSRHVVETKIAAANDRSGRQVAVVVGEMLDPRSAYGAATIVLGMGGSALRAMAFARPLIVQGESGFWRTLTPESADAFLADGWFGVGPGRDGVALLREQLVALLRSPERRRELGDFGRSLVVERFSLSSAAASLEEWYGELLRRRRSPLRRAATVAAAVPQLSRLGAYKVRRRRARRQGRGVSDDFNVFPLPVEASRPGGAISPGPC